MNKEVLKEILNAPSASGDEQAAVAVFNKYMNGFGLKHEFYDNIGNSAFSIGEGETVIMVSGHVDEVAMQVQYITDEGFIHFIKVGFADEKIMPGSVVNITTVDGNTVKGVIGKTPIHIEEEDDEVLEKAIKIKDLKIDVGAESKEEVLEMGINVGDVIHYYRDVNTDLGAHRICGGGLDDKIGVYIVMEVMERLAKRGQNDKNFSELKNVKVYGVACTQEEVGGYGASLAAKRINPNYSIDYDVTFATDDGCVSKEEWGDVKLGKGGGIAFGPDKNRDMCNEMIRVCKKLNIPYQPFAVEAGMTNTIDIKLASTNAKTILLSIPQRNMHTPVEVCDYRDIESLINMTVCYILWLEKTLALTSV